MASIEDNIKRLGGIRYPKNGFVPMPEEEVVELERSLGTRLPESYRRFLVAHGRCKFHGIIAFTTLEPTQPYIDGDTNQGEIMSFLGARTEDGSGIAFSVDTFRDRMPETIIPIGYDMLSNQICIGIAGPERGKIYYWDIDDEWDEEDYTSEGLPVPSDIKFQNVHLIANSFEEFFDQMYVREEG